MSAAVSVCVGIDICHSSVNRALIEKKKEEEGMNEMDERQ